LAILGHFRHIPHNYLLAALGPKCFMPSFHLLTLLCPDIKWRPSLSPASRHYTVATPMSDAAVGTLRSAGLAMTEASFEQAGSRHGIG
jgi:hypothetical protein